MTAAAPMTDQDFDAIRGLLRARSAVVLDAGKQYLVEARLTPLVRELQLNSIGDLVAQVRQRPGNGLDRRIVEALVTTESSFFRDHHPFDGLRKVVLPDLIQRRMVSGFRRSRLAASGTVIIVVAYYHNFHWSSSRSNGYSLPLPGQGWGWEPNAWAPNRGRGEPGPT